MIFTQTSGRFCPGKLVATPAALEQIPPEEWQAAYCRHLHGDWGLLSEKDQRRNEVALRTGERLLSAYATTDGVRFWIITEADRSVTTILLPEEY